ncbi:MAG: 2'-5' RNA ligase family protein [Gemmataceae bacterium]|nr:2'-5' RNA ligase family protein [Gemmataceae bacterium]
MADPLIVTLGLDPATFAVLDALRRRHFPPGRNLVPAHVTLFHHLPGEEELAVSGRLQDVCDGTPPVSVLFPRVRFLGKGVAVEVEAPELIRVRNRLAAGMASWLTPQDRQPYRPHATVQNKADPTAARALYAELAAGWVPFEGRGDRLLLWRYRGGPWEPAGEFSFAGRQTSSPPPGNRV